MAQEIAAGEVFTDVSPGKSVTSTRLNNHVNGGTVLPGAITNQTDVSTALASDDTLLIHDQSASGLKKVQAQNLLVPEAITAKTDISTAIAAGDFLLMADVSASNALLKVQAQNILPPEAISAKTDLSATVAQDDYVLVGDTSASNALKKATVASLHPSGALIQCVATSDTAATAISATIPLDDTIPQSGEGTQLMTQAITPGNSSNILEIEVIVPFAGTTGGAAAVVALFQDATASALAATVADTGSAGYSSGLHLIHRMTAGTTSATTFKVRVGATSGTLTINGASSARLLGGVSAARLIIRELKA
jgi:hypothetical protein